METVTTNATNKPDWQTIVAQYHTPQRSKSIGQLLNTLIPYALLWVVMVKALSISFWLMVPFAVIAGGLLVRTFIIFHDCGHGAFFKSRQANDFWGVVTGIITLTPYQYWRHEHAMHHAHAGNLDERGWADVWTMTLEEYRNASRWTRLRYRVMRNPLCLFFIVPTILFLVIHRLPLRGSQMKGYQSIHWTNLAVFLIALAMSWAIGWKTYLIIQVTVVMMLGAMGVWLFYVQHTFEGVYWERQGQWDYVTEALQGSSFYKLPKVLQWFSGNSGFHHIHHLSPRIPNYLLEKCHNENPLFQEITPVTLKSSVKALKFHLWDEENRRLVGFNYLKQFKPAKN